MTGICNLFECLVTYNDSNSNFSSGCVNFNRQPLQQQPTNSSSNRISPAAAACFAGASPAAAAAAVESRFIAESRVFIAAERAAAAAVRLKCYYTPPTSPSPPNGWIDG